MNDFNNENEIYNNEIDDLNDIKIEDEKIKTNKYNEDQIIMDENINFEQQDNIDNENNINENYEEIYDLNDINNDEFNNNNNDNINLEEYNNAYYNNIPENNDQNLLYKNEDKNNSFSQGEEYNDDNNNNYNIHLDNMNNINELNEINMNNNDNLKNFNENKKLDDIESLKLYIINLEKKCSFLEKENEMIKLNKESDPNYSIVENSLKQGTILLEDVKRKNFNLNKKIKILEKENQELNYKLIEANQKIKRFQINNKNNNINTNKNINSILVKLNKKVDESEILISKLKFDKKLLETKLSEDKKYHENELNLMLNYKNSELSVYQKAIDDFKSQNNNSIHLNNNDNTKNNKINIIQNKLKKVSDKNKILEEKIKSQKKNLVEKDNLINSLNKKVIELEGNFNLKLIEMQQISAENEAQISKLINEKNELIKNNEKLSNGLMQFDNKVKEANLIFMNKTDFYDKSISLFKNKINEYKNKVVLLKKKIKELNLIIERNNINNNTKPKLNNNDIYKRNLSSTPGSFMIPKRRMTPFATKFFDDKNDFIQNNSINMNLNKTNIDIIQDQKKPNFDYLNKSQISQINDNNNLDNNLGYEEDNNQKMFLEKYKSFLTKLKV